MNNWTPLHMHFESSTLDGIIRFKNVSKLKEKGINSVAITDHGTLSGSYEFYKECKKAKIKPIIGMEAYWTLNHKETKQDDLGRSRPNYHMIILAKNKLGFKNLMKLSSQAYIDGFYYDPRIDNKLLEDHSSDLITTSGCLGSRVNQLIIKNELLLAENTLRYYKELFKDNYYIELQNHDMEEQVLVNQKLIEFSKKLSLPIIVTSDSHYMDCHDKELHDKFLAIATHDSLYNPKRFSFEGLNCHVPSYNELIENCSLSNIPEEAIINTNYIADQINPNYYDNIINKYPTFKELPEDFKSWEYLEYLVKTQYLLQNNNELPPKHIEDRIDYELKVIKKMGFSDYILILWDIIENGVKAKNYYIGPGRGSAAGSYIMYLLGITEVNPLKYDLLFERFLDEGRAATPKIFMD